MSKSRSLLASMAGLAVGVAGLTALAPPASANPAGTGLVINEVYVNGGSNGATYTNKYVELFNPTGAAINLADVAAPYSVQYRAPGSTGNSTGVVALTGTIAAGGYYTLQGNSNGANGVAVPGVDQSSTLGPGATGGTITLVSGTAAVDPSSSASVVDKVGWGTSNTPEGTAASGNSVTKTLSRNDISKDTDVNSADFTAMNPTPDAVNSPVVIPPDPPVAKTIAEIQGTGAATTLVAPGNNVITQGVVTAKYPTGGIDGFYIQTGGSGGATDATPGASDGIFVYGSSFVGSVAVGDSVEVTGLVTEFGEMTEITASAVTQVTPALAPVTAQTVLPGTDCALPGTACLTGAALEAAREAHEGELYQPAGNFTVTDSYDGSPYPSTSSSNFGEIGLAARSTIPLSNPTEVIDAQATADIADRVAYNNAHRIILNDGSSTNYTTTTGSAYPWLTATHTVRMGAAVTFPEPVIFDYRSNGWRLEPSGGQVVGAPTGKVTIAQDRPAAPETVGGDLKLATFNVLNYFTTLGANVAGCTSHNDRDNNPVSVNSCPGTGPRGAWNTDNFNRQQTKIVNAINTLDADIVSLEELENSALVDGGNRDEAIGALVSALNAASTAGRWDFVPSPAAIPSGEDVIRTGFIYNPNKVALVGLSEILIGQTAFDNAREPLAQVFKRKGATDADGFVVVVNHFKSKGSGTPDPNGQGNANADRVAQANALATFANNFASSRGVTKIYLTGDFNAYSMEDPIQALNTAGFEDLHSTTNPDEESYGFDGGAGSLDHVFANAAAKPDVTGVDIWNINANEPVFYEYSRYNTNVTDLYAPGPFRASDHNPEIVGIKAPLAASGPRTIQILGINDFHGRILNNTANGEAGAATLAAAVKQLRAANPDTVFAAAGDLIGASTFESFIAKDKPTIDALNEAGLQVSAAGNHEFDAGYDDLLNRVMAPYDATTNPYGGAEWKYLSANVENTTPGADQLDPSWIRDFGDVQVGFIGVVTEDLLSLVSPAGMQGVVVDDIVDSVNAEADLLKGQGVDVIVMLVHEGAATVAYSSVTDNSAFGQIVAGVNANVDAIISGHTHLAYNHKVPVQAWIDAGRTVTERPVVSAGQYGTNLNQLLMKWDPAANGGQGALTDVQQAILPLKSGQTPNYAPEDPATKAIVDAAVANSNVLGAAELGKIAGPFNRAFLSNGTTENRGGESTLGNLVAEVQRWATSTPEAGAAEIAFMNPGGLRADMKDDRGVYPAVMTYKKAAAVQPFANTLVNMELTGAQIKTVLEQQWQTVLTGPAPSRPFLRLGISEGFTYTYDPDAAQDKRIKQMWLNGTEILPTDTFSVTANSFLASGGDNFREFANGTNRADTGKVDLEAMVDYLDEFANTNEGDQPLPVGYRQISVGWDFPAGAPATYAKGGQVEFQLSSLVFTTAADKKDSDVIVSIDGVVQGTFPVNKTVGDVVYDESGLADVSFFLPLSLAAGDHVLKIEGVTTGTTSTYPIKTSGTQSTVQPEVEAQIPPIVHGTDTPVVVNVQPSYATGTVTIMDGTTVVATGPVTDGVATLTIPGDALAAGAHDLTVSYSGGPNVAPSTASVQTTVAKGEPEVQVTTGSTMVEAGGSTTVTVTVPGGTGTVDLMVNGAPAGQVTLVDGVGTATVGPFTTAGAVKVEAAYSGDANFAPRSGSTTVSVVPPASPKKADPTVAVTLSTASVITKDGKVTATATVTSTGPVPTGTIAFFVNGVKVADAALVGGVATAELGPFNQVGPTAVEAIYLGDAATNAGIGSSPLVVNKAKPKMTIKVKPKKIIAKKTKGKVVIKLKAPGQVVTGYVSIKVAGKIFLKKVKKGQVKLTLKPFKKAGKYKLMAQYLGNDWNKPVKKKVVIKVKK